MKRWDPDALLPEFVRNFEPYTPSKPDGELMKLFGCDRILRLNNNENPLGPPPAAQEVLRRFPPKRAAVYPSGDSYYLRQALSRKFDKDPERFLVGNGANEVISFVIKAFCEQGDNIVTADKTFAVYEWVARFSGIDARLAPLKDFGFDDRAMLDLIDDRTKVVFICNPNNPTGSYWDSERLERFLDEVDGRAVVVLDEAYYEFVDKDDFPNGMDVMERHPNVVVFRTFSKMYGLAGLRIGWLCGGHDVVQAVRRTCIVYSVNGPAQEAALAALHDEDHVRLTRELVGAGKGYLHRELKRLGLKTVCGEGNFMMIKAPMADTLAYRKLMRRGVMIRTMSGFRFPNWIRITIAEMDAMRAFIQAMEEALGPARGVKPSRSALHSRQGDS